MKHLESVNEWFGNKLKEGDEFAKKLIDIIEKENIKINQNFSFYVDGIRYKFDDDNLLYDYLYVYQDTRIDLKVSKKYFKCIKELYLKQENEKKLKELEKLPDISDVGRMSKKFNI